MEREGDREREREVRGDIGVKREWENALLCCA